MLPQALHCTTRSSRTAEPSLEAACLTSAIPCGMLIDLHADTPLWQHWLNYDFCRAHSACLAGRARGSPTWTCRACKQVQIWTPRCLVWWLCPSRLDGYRYHSWHDSAACRTSLSKDPENFVSGSHRHCSGNRPAHVASGWVYCPSRACTPCAATWQRADTLIDPGCGFLWFGALSRQRSMSASVWSRSPGRSRPLRLSGGIWWPTSNDRGVILDLTHINRTGFFDALEVKRRAGDGEPYRGGGGASRIGATSTMPRCAPSLSGVASSV